MRAMGLDVGDKTIGVAVSDLMGWTAQGVEVIRRKALKHDLDRLKEIINKEEVKMIVVGLPKNMNGSLGPQAEKVLEFVKTLEVETNLEILLWDERLTTSAAERTLIEADVRRSKRRQVIDKMAAVLILQGFLDSGGFKK